MMNSKRLLLIFDLDETLVHSTKAKLNQGADFEVGGYYIYKRPHLDAFLKACSKKYRIAIWSSAQAEYVKEVVEKVVYKHVELEFIWTRQNCSVKVVKKPLLEGFNYGGFYKEHQWIKPLKKVKNKLESTLIIDNSPYKVIENQENALIIKSFEGEQGDNELDKLLVFLPEFEGVEDVRKIDKRSWKLC